ncbi:MAG: hypothetical protein KAR06_03295, partial [Deltaproteobacteria bacterium]|nr:hypothetical protein [Deltaproteobacteria bacterium]
YIVKKRGACGDLFYVQSSYYEKPFVACRKQISIRMHGMEKALEMAIEFREEGLNETVRKGVR